MEDFNSNLNVPPEGQSQTASGRAEDTFAPGHAPWHSVTDTTLVSIEHPYIIKNVDRGIRSLGGIKEIRKVLDAQKPGGEGDPRSLGLLLRPCDALSKPIMSKVAYTNNILLKITVPRKTGRKRKRGSSEPFENCAPANGAISNGHLATSDPKNASVPSELIRSLRDNIGTSKVEAVGTVNETHRFRALPDFAYSTADSPLMQQIEEHILSFQYQKILGFELDTRRDAVDMIPPPGFSQMTMPFNYLYHQNPAVKLITDHAGRPSTTNAQTAPRLLTRSLHSDDPVVPTGPVPEALPEDLLDKTVKSLVGQLRELLEERPIMTRRYILNKISREHEYHLKFAIQYVGYIFRSGPWREAIIKYGVDPRTDPQYRRYQTVMFKLAVKQKTNEPTGWEDHRGIYRRSALGKELDKESHLFDGKKLVQDGKTWQVCDISEPTLRQMLDTQNMRTECETRLDGWYHNGTWAAVRVLMRDMIHTILSGKVPNPADYYRLARLPEIIDKSTLHLRPFGRLHDSKSSGTDKEILLSHEIRNMAKAQAPDLIGIDKESSVGQRERDMEGDEGELEGQSDGEFEDPDEDMIDSVEVDQSL